MNRHGFIAMWRRYRVRMLLLLLLPVFLFINCGVEGDRAANGECPRDEICSESTPLGLYFVGSTFYDAHVLKLGPVLADGEFTVALRPLGGHDMPAFNFEIEDPGVMSGVTLATYDWESNDEPELRLTGLSAGSTYLRILHGIDGKLLDRLKIQVVELDDVKVENMNGESGHLLAGCQHMIGVRLHARDAGLNVRAFDETVTISAKGATLAGEEGIWDCFIYDVPEGASSVDFTVKAAGQTFHKSLPVQKLAEDDPEGCPPVNLD